MCKCSAANPGGILVGLCVCVNVCVTDRKCVCALVLRILMACSSDCVYVCVFVRVCVFVCKTVRM